MPELPEVEHIARYLHDELAGRRIVRLARLEEDRYLRDTTAASLRRRLAGRDVRRVGRRGKWLVFELDGRDGNGEAAERLVVHLKMTGKVWVAHGPLRRDDPARWVLEMDDGRLVRYEDMRKFGWVRLVDAAAWDALESTLGPEPLEPGFTGKAMNARLASRRGRLKPILLDQTFVVGIGNIYADEILWAARLHPLARVEHLDHDDRRRLHRATRRILRRAVDEREGVPDQERVGGGGAKARATEGLALEVFQRTGERCRRCRGTIERIVVATRGTHYCPGCQPAPARAEARTS